MTYIIYAAYLLFCTAFSDCYLLPRIVVIAALTLWVWWKREEAPGECHLSVAVYILLAAVVLSFLFSLDKWFSLLGAYRSYATGVLPIFLYAAIFLGCDEKEDEILKACSIAGAIASCYCVLQRLDLEPFVGVQHPVFRTIGPIGSAVFLGAVLIVSFLSSLHLRRWLEAVASAVGIYLTVSRAPILGVCVGAAVYYALIYGGERVKKWAPLAFLVAILLPLTVTTVFLYTPTPDIRGTDRKTSDRNRIETWKVAHDVIKAYPILGSGPNTFLVAFRRHRGESMIRSGGERYGQDDAHNLHLETLASLGFVGWGALVFIIIIVSIMTPYPPIIYAILSGVGVYLLVEPATFSLLCILSAIVGGATVCRGPGSPWKKRVWMGVVAVILSVYYVNLMADRHFRQAESLSNKGKVEDLIREAETAIALFPWSPLYQLTYARSMLTLESKNPWETYKWRARALGVAEEYIRYHPEEPNGYHMKGEALLAMRKYKEADEALGQAYDMDPYFTFILTPRAYVAKQLGDKASAERWEREADALRAMGAHSGM